MASMETLPPPGVVELREDVPLKPGGSSSKARCCGGGPRFILASFAALTAGITLALITQIYYGDYEVVPHGSVSSSAAACSRAGTDALKAGGRAIDAAVTAALCLAVLAPHRNSLDASGSLLYWDYRADHANKPSLYEWGGPGLNINDTERPPRLLAALASLHANLGVLPLSRVLQPAIDLARGGFLVSEGLSVVTAAANGVSIAPGTTRTAPLIANYLEKIQNSTMEELSKLWAMNQIRKSEPYEAVAGSWRMFAGGAGAAVAGKALAAALQPNFPNDEDVAFERVVTSLQQAALLEKGWPPTGVSTGLAVIDRLDTYVALTTGLSTPFGSGPMFQGGWPADEPAAPLDLAPAIIVGATVCGTRYVVGAESSSALAQGAASLLVAGIEAGAIETARVSVYTGGVVAIEATREPPVGLPVAFHIPVVNANLPYPAVNVVQQKGDSLLSHADSRGGGLASRF